MSYLLPLSSCSTPGWNDPPTVLDPTKTSSSPSSGALANRHRRPVHPSIQASNISPGYTNPVQPVLSPQATNLSVAVTQIPVLTSDQQATFYGTAPQSVIPPVPNYATMDSFIPYSTSSSTGRTKNRSLEKTSSLQQHRSIFDAFNVPDHNQQVLPKSTSLTHDISAANLPQSSLQKSVDVNLSTSAVVQVASPIERNPNALIYVPPNVINENNRRPATSPYPTDYVAPVKAAGDVSLSGFQLVQFLIKATYRLPNGVTRDGIQLRINQLNEMMSAGQVTDSCIKKLNFVVDALDRGLFDEAYQFFEQLQTSFPTEARTGWAQGIRLLLNELRRPARIGSAGPAQYL
uniref:SRA1/Sec31 domain-containing protein n=1 Tax=Setaria digitata TaxID=48799 RepID=A0A915Q6N8_9BILA